MFWWCQLTNCLEGWNKIKKFSKTYKIYVTLDHKTSHKGNFFEIEIYTSSES